MLDVAPMRTFFAGVLFAEVGPATPAVSALRFLNGMVNAVDRQKEINLCDARCEDCEGYGDDAKKKRRERERERSIRQKSVKVVGAVTEIWGSSDQLIDRQLRPQ
jgi:hypothetical protein